MMPSNDDSARRLLANPYYAVNFADSLFGPHDLLAREDWIVLNAKLIEDIGPENWLNELLAVLADPSAEDVHDSVNPSGAAQISKQLAGRHETIIERDAWIAANTKLIAEIGPAEWLDLLLNVLEAGNQSSNDLG